MWFSLPKNRRIAVKSFYFAENSFKRIGNHEKPFKHITDVNEAIVLVQGGVEEVDVIMVNYFDEGAPEFEIAESMSDEYYRIKVRFEFFSEIPVAVEYVTYIT